MFGRFGAQEGNRFARADALDERNDLFADENAEQPDQGDGGRCGRTHAKQAVNQPNQQADGERDEIWLHLGHFLLER